MVMLLEGPVALGQDVDLDGTDIPTLPDAPNPRLRMAATVAEEGRPVGTIGRVGLIVLAAMSFGLVTQIVVVSGVQHRSAQQRAFDGFRKELAEGTAPLGQRDRSGRLLPGGTPVAYLEIPSLGIHEVVVEGTSSGILTSGPGHRRDTPLPGQGGTSVLFGRQAVYGGPFRRLGSVHIGAKVVVTTGQGVSTFRVIDIRGGGAPIPPALAAGNGRLQLVTAAGTPFVPSGVVRIDADLVTPTLVAPPSVVTSSNLAPSEQVMASDTTTVWELVLWLQALVVVAIGAVASWVRWGHQQTWIVFFPLTALVGLFANGQFLKLLPNLF